MKRFVIVLACAAAFAWVAHMSKAAPRSCCAPASGGSSTGRAATASAAPASCPNCPTGTAAAPATAPATTATAAAPAVACPKCITAAELQVVAKDTVAIADTTPAKEVTLEGTIVCSKCSLKQTASCGNAILVKEDGKTVTYFLADKGNGETYHATVCGGGAKAGTVVGTVSEKGGKKYITPSKVTYKG